MQNVVSTTEIFKWVHGYEGLYRISNFGFVYSYWNNPEGKKLSLGRQYKKPRYIGLWKDGEKKAFAVKVLVAFAFIKEMPQGTVVRNKDGNNKNNHVSNLEYVL